MEAICRKEDEEVEEVEMEVPGEEEMEVLGERDA